MSVATVVAQRLLQTPGIDPKEAIYQAGNLFSSTSPNYPVAAELYEYASFLGHRDAMVKLGNMYQNLGNAETARIWYCYALATSTPQ